MGRGRLRRGGRMPGIAPRAAQNRGLGTPAFADGPACGDKGTALFRNSDAARPEKIAGTEPRRFARLRKNPYLRPKTESDMNTDLRFIPFRSTADKGWEQAWAIYQESFPPCEKRSLDNYVRAFDDPAFAAEGIWLGDRLAGIFFRWRDEGFHYLEHLAVSPAMRGHNIGSEALAAFCRSVAEPVVLEIEPPVEEIAIRRLHFYRRLGFVENPCRYIHPSYEEPFAPHPLVLMSYPAPFTTEQLRRTADFVRERVLRYSGHKSLTEPRLEE